jgi:hypothetical protein
MGRPEKVYFWQNKKQKEASKGCQSGALLFRSSNKNHTVTCTMEPVEAEVNRNHGHGPRPE